MVISCRHINIAIKYNNEQLYFFKIQWFSIGLQCKVQGVPHTNIVVFPKHPKKREIENVQVLKHQENMSV